MECVIWIVNMHVFIFAELTLKHFRIFMCRIQMLMLLYDLNNNLLPYKLFVNLCKTFLSPHGLSQIVGRSWVMVFGSRESMKWYKWCLFWTRVSHLVSFNTVWCDNWLTDWQGWKECLVTFLSEKLNFLTNCSPNFFEI